MATNQNSASLLDVIRKLNGTAEAALEVQLPQGGEHYYYSNFPAYSGPLKEGLATIQQALNTCEAIVRPRRAAPPDFTDADDVAEWTSNLLDDVLERLDAALDADRSRARGQDTGGAAAGGVVDDAALMANLPSFGGTSVRPTRVKGPVRHAAGLARPQDLFQPAPDNRLDLPWRPRVDHLAGLTAAPLQPQHYQPAPGAPEAFPHPFAAELEALPLNYPPAQLAPPPSPPQAAAAVAPKALKAPKAPPAAAPPPPASPESCPLVWVDSEEALAGLVGDLTEEGVTELAVDLEQHGYRSFQGFTCLMQLSTRTTDYVVDTLALRNQLGPALARVFADPRVVKVLHGADSDVEWLQRDFSLFLVNMFDTGQASRVLGLSSHGLAHLLDTLCGFQADKRYQLADWRLRPLSPDMLHYARCDTHFLLYVYDRLREQLAGLPDDRIPPSLSVPLLPGGPRGALGLVLERSRQLCLKTYRKPAFDPAGYKDTLLRWGMTLSPPQTSVFAALLAWRDRVSRAEDESPGYVLPKAQLLSLAQAMPENAKRVQAVLGRAVSEVLLRRIAEVVQVVADARHRPPQEPPITAAAQQPQQQLPSQQQGQQPAAAAAVQAAAAAPVKPLAVLKPRAVAPIRTAKVGATPAPAAAASAPAPAAAPPAQPAQQQQPGSTSEAADAADAPQGPAGGASGDGAAVVSTSASAAAPATAAPAAAPALGGLKPRALKAPPLAVSRSAALFGGGGAALAATAAGTTEAAAAAERPNTGEVAGSAGSAGTASASAVAAAPAAAPASGAAVGTRPTAMLKRAGGSSLMGAFFGGRPAAAAAPSTTDQAAAAAASTSGDGDEEELLAQQRVKRLRATFAMPFVGAAASPLPQAKLAGAAAAPADSAGGAPEAAAAPDAAAVPPKHRATAADIRAAVEAMHEEGEMDVVVGPDGQGVEVPAGTATTAAASGRGSGGAADGGEGAAGGLREAPETRSIALDGSEEEEADEGEADEDGDEDGEMGEAEEEGAAPSAAEAAETAVGGAVAGAGGGGLSTRRVAGSELGLDVLDFVPVPLSQMYPKDKNGKKRDAQGLRDGRGGGRHAANMRRFVTDIAPTAAAAPGGVDTYDPSDSGDDQNSGSDSDEGHTVGPFAKKKTKRPQAKKQRSNAQIAEAAAAAAQQQPQRGRGAGGRGRGRGRGGRPAPTGLAAEFPRSERSLGGRGSDRGGRGGRNARGGRIGGRQPTAFNPYDIPDEFLMKGGKRSSVMPRSGNRSHTFK